MCRPSDKWIRQRRAELMSRTSDAEKAARKNIEALGYEVVCQQPIWTGRKMYFADIYIPSLKTVIEIDGGYHLEKRQKRLDNNRSCGLWRKGLHVLRLSNADARSVQKVKRKIELIVSMCGYV